MRRDTILITGANGQLGSVLTGELQKVYGVDRVLTTDIRPPRSNGGQRFEILDILNPKRLAELIDQYKVNQIYHLAAILSAKGEQNPLFTWKINMDGLFNVLEVAREKKLSKVFFPSSIAVFGDDIPKRRTPQNSVLRPSTVYGISKAAAENWCQYYFENYDVDVRSVRYPGVIGYQTMAGGGTTDYAVDIFHYAIQGRPFNCFLQEDSRLPMIYMDDAIRATIEIMAAPTDQIKTRTSYNIHGMDFTPVEITREIQKYFPDFRVNYLPDHRQAIADTWPASVDDSDARIDWNWSPIFNLKTMTKEMLFHLSKKYKTITS
ncbi:MAG: NAD-dependent epimerase/dehydratase family protein [Bacteroidota bacterium]